MHTSLSSSSRSRSYIPSLVVMMLMLTGMMTSAKGQFQFDGNAGLLAVVHEMLLQSHIPQVGAHTVCVVRFHLSCIHSLTHWLIH